MRKQSEEEKRGQLSRLDSAFKATFSAFFLYIILFYTNIIFYCLFKRFVYVIVENLENCNSLLLSLKSVADHLFLHVSYLGCFIWFLLLKKKGFALFNHLYPQILVYCFFFFFCKQIGWVWNWRYGRELWLGSFLTHRKLPLIVKEVCDCSNLYMNSIKKYVSE